MNVGIAALIFVLLLAVGIAQLLWAFGQSWPIRDPALLARTVVGTAGVERVPRLRALLTGIAALIAGVVALALADETGGGWPLTILGAIIALGLAARGALGYTPWWRARTPEEPYRTLDERNYSPLYIGLALGFAALVLMRL
jgi:hypothetical protein